MLLLFLLKVSTRLFWCAYDRLIDRWVGVREERMSDGWMDDGGDDDDEGLNGKEQPEQRLFLPRSLPQS